MYHAVKGYYPVKNGMIEQDKFYVLCLKNLRKPYLLRFSCKSEFLAKRYILSNPDIYQHEVIKGEQALDRGIFVSRKPVTKKKFPCQYSYPPHITSPSRRQQFRTAYRSRMRKASSKVANLKQFTLKHKGKLYVTYHYSYEKAFKHLRKVTNITWNYFTKKVSIRPQYVKGRYRLVKAPFITLIMINQFNNNHAIRKIYNPRLSGKVSRLEIQLLQNNKPKPKALVF